MSASECANPRPLLNVELDRRRGVSDQRDGLATRVGEKSQDELCEFAAR